MYEAYKAVYQNAINEKTFCYETKKFFDYPFKKG